MAKNIVDQNWLVEHLSDPDLIIADCRFNLSNPEEGQQQYDQDHIPGAVYFHLNSDLSAPVKRHGGRHPFPDIAKMSALFGQKGIDHEKKVVAYDSQGGAMASRLWFLLKYLGHDNVYILDQGYPSWKEQGYPISSERPNLKPVTFIPRVRREMLCTMDEVKRKLTDSSTIIIDSRSHDRFRGENETIDPVGGHIPGARNEFWMESLQPNGSWKTKQQQEERLRDYLQIPDREFILYCGSGVTACANYLAFDEVGLKPKLYAGSWSDWISYEDNPVSTGEE